MWSPNNLEVLSVVGVLSWAWVLQLAHNNSTAVNKQNKGNECLAVIFKRVNNVFNGGKKSKKTLITYNSYLTFFVL